MSDEKTLKQQLQEKICKSQCDECAFRLEKCTLIEDILAFWREWLEQKRQEVLARKPTRIDDVDNQAIRQFIRELLEELDHE